MRPGCGWRAAVRRAWAPSAARSSTWLKSRFFIRVLRIGVSLWFLGAAIVPPRRWTGLVQAEVSQAEQRAVFQALRLNDVAGTGVAVHNRRHADDVRPGFAGGSHGGEWGVAGGRGVLDDEHILAGDILAFDAALHAVLLGFLANDEGIDPLAGVHDRGGDRVGAEGQPADVGVLPVAGQLAQELADELGGLRVQGGAAQVDVVVGLLAGGEGDFAVDDGELLDELSESRSGDAVDGGGFLGHGTRSFRRRGSKLCCSLS